MGRLLASALLALLLVLPLSLSVDRAKFRQCRSTGFCRRHRGSPSTYSYSLDAASLSFTADGRVTASLSGGPVKLLLQVSLVDGPDSAFGGAPRAARVRVTEENPKEARWESGDILQKGAGGPAAEAFGGKKPGVEEGVVRLEMGGGFRLEVRMEAPFSIAVYDEAAGPAGGGEPVVEVNSEKMFYFEHHRTRVS